MRSLLSEPSQIRWSYKTLHQNFAWNYEKTCLWAIGKESLFSRCIEIIFRSFLTVLIEYVRPSGWNDVLFFLKWLFFERMINILETTRALCMRLRLRTPMFWFSTWFFDMHCVAAAAAAYFDLLPWNSFAAEEMFNITAFIWNWLMPELVENGSSFRCYCCYYFRYYFNTSRLHFANPFA